MALQTVADRRRDGQPDPWAVPDLEPCSPLCERVFPSKLIQVHRGRCDRFDTYVLGCLLAQWPAHRPWA